MSRDYFDIDGNPCTLDQLCRKEPMWAASRLRVADARIAQLDALVAIYEAWTARRGVTIEQVAYVRERTATLYTEAEKDESVAAVLRRAGWMDFPGLDGGDDE